MKSVLKKLMKARLTLQATKLQKTGWNDYSKYKYFELGDFLPTIQQIFSDLDLAGVVSFEVELATLTITDLETGESINVHSPMSSANLKASHEVQNLGAVQTYIRRYLWVTALEIVEHDALDAVTGKVAPPVESAKSVPLSDWDALPEDEKEFLTEIAMNVTDHLGKGDVAGALNVIDEAKLDATEKTALWSRFDSKQRSAMKNHKPHKEAA